MRCFFFLLILLWQVIGSDDLILVQEVFRHGARYALAPTYQPQLPSSIYGQLTSVGKRMHYLLGRQLYSEYWSRLNMPDYYNASLIKANSTDFNRTIQSCQSQLFGWLQTVKKAEYQGQPLFDDINFQPVPIYVYQKNIMYADGEGEPMLYYDYPNSVKWREQNYESEFYMIKIKPMVDRQLEFLKTNFGLDFNRTELTAFIDVYHSNKSIGFDLHPIFKMPEHKGVLEVIYIICQYLDIIYSQDQITVATTLLFTEIKNNLLAAIRKTSPVRLRLYSAHDVTLMSLLIGLNLTNAELAYQKYVVENTTVKGAYSYPPYASNLLFELAKSEQNILSYSLNYNIQPNYVVKVRYNGQYLPLAFCKNKDSCSIQDFLEYLDKIINPNYKILGGFSHLQITRYGTTIALSCLLLAYIVYKGVMLWRRKTGRFINGSRPASTTESPPSNDEEQAHKHVQMKQF